MPPSEPLCMYSIPHYKLRASGENAHSNRPMVHSPIPFQRVYSSHVKFWFSRYLVRSTFIFGSWIRILDLSGTVTTSISFRDISGNSGENTSHMHRHTYTDTHAHTIPFLFKGRFLTQTQILDNITWKAFSIPSFIQNHYCTHVQVHPQKEGSSEVYIWTHLSSSGTPNSGHSCRSPAVAHTAV